MLFIPDCVVALFAEREGQGLTAASPKLREGGEREDWRRGVRTRESQREREKKRGREGSGETQRAQPRPPFSVWLGVNWGEEPVGRVCAEPSSEERGRGWGRRGSRSGCHSYGAVPDTEVEEDTGVMFLF